MKLTSEILDRLCQKVLSKWKEEKALTLKVNEQAALQAMKQPILAELQAKEEIKLEAEKLLDQYGAQMADQIDRGKMLKMIKDKLEKERGIVL
ncbi:MAG TPA: hypothetical protein VJL87_00540 [Bdellovibrionota bacterium]|nr:hypothetical protein [Bdellovibrionota bacterium]